MINNQSTAMLFMRPFQWIKVLLFVKIPVLYTVILGVQHGLLHHALPHHVVQLKLPYMPCSLCITVVSQWFDVFNSTKPSLT